MAAGDVAECQGRPERDAGPRIISIHDRTHVVAAGIETRDNGAIVAENPGMAIGSETDRRAEVRRIDPQRVKRGLLDRCDAWIRPVAGVAEMTLIDRGAAAEFRVEPHPGMRIVSVDRCRER